MLYCGIDVHKKSSVIHIMDEKCKKVAASTIPTTPTAYERFFEKYQGDIHIAMEIGRATFTLCDTLSNLRIPVHVVNSTENSFISKSLKKSDKEDAWKLSYQLNKDILPEPVYVPDRLIRHIRSLNHQRYYLVKRQTSIITTTHSLLECHCIKSLKSSMKHPCGWERLKEEITDSGLLFQFMIYMEQHAVLYAHIRRVEEQINAVIQQAEQLQKMKDQLISIPGVGEHTSNVLIGIIGDISRFKSSRHLVSYLGLSPIMRQSGEKTGTGFGITKKGNSLARGYLTQGAVAILRSKQLEAKPLQDWYQKIRVKKGWAKARIALARKMVSIIYGVLKQEEIYDMEKVTLKTAA